MKDLIGFFKLCAVFVFVFWLVIGGGILLFWMVYWMVR